VDGGVVCGFPWFFIFLMSHKRVQSGGSEFGKTNIDTQPQIHQIAAFSLPFLI
jgi:hypothetical protein